MHSSTRISAAHDGPFAVVRVAGRLDGETAEQLADTLEQMLREGSRAALLDLGGVTYVSTPGIQAINRMLQEFTALRGELRVSPASAAARDALRLAELEHLVLAGGDKPVSASGIFSRPKSAITWTVERTTAWQTPGGGRIANGSYEFTPATEGAQFACRTIGDPHWPAAGGIHPADCRIVSLPETALAVGVGTIGDDLDDALPRLGELAAAAGVVAAQPTDGGSRPDFLIGAAGGPPAAVLGAGLVCDGHFAQAVRFTKLPDAEGVPLSELAQVCLQASGDKAVGFVCMAEVGGLVGAWLRRSPGVRGDGERFTFGVPAVRGWMGCSPERMHGGTSAMIAGVVGRPDGGPLAPWMAPLDDRGEIVGHLHATVFSYRPVPLRTVAPRALVTKFFGQQKVRAVLHLLADDRGTIGAGESRFVRGICWIAPIAEVTPLGAPAIGLAAAAPGAVP